MSGSHWGGEVKDGEEREREITKRAEIIKLMKVICAEKWGKKRKKDQESRTQLGGVKVFSDWSIITEKKMKMKGINEGSSPAGGKDKDRARRKDHKRQWREQENLQHKLWWKKDASITGYAAEIKTTVDKKERERLSDEERRRGFVLFVLILSRREMIINEAAGRRLPAPSFRRKAVHKSFGSNYLSLTISAATATHFRHQFPATPDIPSPTGPQ